MKRREPEGAAAVIRRIEERGLLPLAKRVADRCGVSVFAMFANHRASECVHSRYLFAAALRARGHWSFPRIGELIGRDHTTVMNGVAQISPIEVRELEPERSTIDIAPLARVTPVGVHAGASCDRRVA